MIIKWTDQLNNKLNNLLRKAYTGGYLEGLESTFGTPEEAWDEAALVFEEKLTTIVEGHEIDYPSTKLPQSVEILLSNILKGSGTLNKVIAGQIVAHQDDYPPHIAMMAKAISPATFAELQSLAPDKPPKYTGPEKVPPQPVPALSEDFKAYVIEEVVKDGGEMTAGSHLANLMQSNPFGPVTLAYAKQILEKPHAYSQNAIKMAKKLLQLHVDYEKADFGVKGHLMAWAAKDYKGPVPSSLVNWAQTVAGGKVGEYSTNQANAASALLQMAVGAKPTTDEMSALKGLAAGLVKFTPYESFGQPLPPVIKDLPKIDLGDGKYEHPDTIQYGIDTWHDQKGPPPVVLVQWAQKVGKDSVKAGYSQEQLQAASAILSMNLGVHIGTHSKSALGKFMAGKMPSTPAKFTDSPKKAPHPLIQGMNHALNQVEADIVSWDWANSPVPPLSVLDWASTVKGGEGWAMPQRIAAKAILSLSQYQKPTVPETHYLKALIQGKLHFAHPSTVDGSVLQGLYDITDGDAPVEVGTSPPHVLIPLLLKADAYAIALAEKVKSQGTGQPEVVRIIASLVTNGVKSGAVATYALNWAKNVKFQPSSYSSAQQEAADWIQATLLLQGQIAPEKQDTTGGSDMAKGQGKKTSFKPVHLPHDEL